MSLMFELLLATGFCVVAIVHEASGFSTEVEAALKTEKHIYVATRRVNGEWSTPAPVWFMYDGEAVYLTTAPSSHKAHRIRRGSPVRVCVGKKGRSNHRWIVGGKLCLLRPIDRDQRCSMLNYPGVSTVVLMPWQGE